MIRIQIMFTHSHEKGSGTQDRRFKMNDLALDSTSGPGNFTLEIIHEDSGVNITQIFNVDHDTNTISLP